MNIIIRGLSPQPFVFTHSSSTTPTNLVTIASIFNTLTNVEPHTNPSQSSSHQPLATTTTQQQHEEQQQQHQQQHQQEEPQSTPPPHLTSFIVYANQTYIDPIHFFAPLTTAQPIQSFQYPTTTNELYDRTPSTIQTLLAPTTTTTLQTIDLIFRPKLLGGKGGFGNNLRGQARKKRLPTDESNLRNIHGERLGAERERALLRQLEEDLREQERGQGRNPSRVTVIATDLGINDPRLAASRSTVPAAALPPLDSHSAIERLGTVIVAKDDNVVRKGGDVFTATEIANSVITQDDAIKRGLAAAIVNVGNTNDDNNNHTLVGGRNIPVPLPPQQAPKPKSGDCGLDLDDLSDLDDEDDDEEEEEGDDDDGDNDDKDD